MTESDLLPERPSGAVDADEWTLHHRLLYRLVLGTPGTTTEELQLLYELVAPVVYQGTTSSACDSRRWRRKLLNDLVDEGRVESVDTPRGRVWLPVKTPETLLERAPTAQAARDERVAATRTDGGADGRE